MKPLPDSPLSIWLDIYKSYKPERPLKGEQKVDIAIIGGGFTGVSTAYYLKKANPSLHVALLEAKTIGYGASGRNGSFAMTVVGLGFEITPVLLGKERFILAHRYMMRAVDDLDEFIQRENIDCDRIRPGFLRVATTQGYIKRLKKEIELMNSFGFEDIYWIDQEETKARVNSPRYLGAMWEPRLLLIDPAKLVRGERELALKLGVNVYENTPALEITSQPSFQIKTPEGRITSDKLVFATNAYTHLFPGLKRKQIPAFTYMIATEPLRPDQLDPIGWKGFEGIEDARNLIHYYRITPDHRLVMGGGPVGLTYGNSLYGDNSASSWQHLENHIKWLFPSLEKIKITHRWGGPFSVTVDLTPVIGYVGDKRAIYSAGCIGHGVSTSHLNAQTICDMLLDRKTDLLDCPFVDRRMIPWPPEPLRMGIAMALRGYLQVEDWIYERKLMD